MELVEKFGFFFLTSLYVTIILGVFAYQLKKILLMPQNPEKMLITFEYFAKEIEKLTHFFKNDIATLKNELHSVKNEITKIKEEQYQTLLKEFYQLKGLVEKIANNCYREE